ncbi:MAG TPA: hypothetical protein VMC86_08680 [Gemmatimonadales bacterium]|nr:hypothetical protein [Gemmatimonadales bacterium]
MTQTPPPSLPQIPIDWNMFVNDTLAPLIAVVVIGVGMVIALRVIMKSPVGEAWAERIRRKTRAKFGEPGALSGEQAAIQIEAVQDQMGRIEAHLSELTERIDFTERILAKQRDPNAIGPGR